jgi:cytochrome o ubiquinol oxidase subunit IV
MRQYFTATSHTSVLPYLLGFCLSAILTVTAYLVARHHLLSGTPFVILLLGLALLQALIQLVLFLELGREAKPRWKLYTFFFMATVLLIVVLGSLWIMSNLRYNLG